MQVIDTIISDVKIVEPKVFGDERGFFLETFHAKRYQEMLNIDSEFVQDNHSRSCFGVLRGLHFQKSNPQGKLVRVVRGTVFDVAVDIRPDSPTFGKWAGVELSEDNRRQLWVPPGLAHGFVVLSDVADFEYKCTDYYKPSDEGCLKWDDAEVGIEWPISSVQLSAKDEQGLSLKELFPR
ncbi:dTDP-4-dehydrorhamnose 3,5-epimerase [Vibrio sp. SM6]|uniref:dTDP-4-dehydrorhamnose 3,5-epimerase n=1 Tax=Vibrio agarilyticus TaxID=2726741 RepID=A0A7X8TRG5_9VIBR|nr:dTDP-4-dehydrorhamnose 3,5-epimerase [Vibrio agarilyticus]NLS13520.1 dTDP-4-dehydrorhamnose 3,5-epimerase [Vibrio agarilyticus]